MPEIEATFVECNPAVVQAAGKNVSTFDNFFDSLRIASPRWDASPTGYSPRRMRLLSRTEDFAKLGQLYLQKAIRTAGS